MSYSLVCDVVAVHTIVTKKVAGQEALKIEGELINIYKKRGVYLLFGFAFFGSCIVDVSQGKVRRGEYVGPAIENIGILCCA